MIKVKNLTIQYIGTKKPVLDDISFGVKKGEVVAILGPSGCGKTTLINAIANILDLSTTTKKGEILCEGEVRVVFQEARLLPWKNVFFNAAVGLDIIGASKEVIEKRVNKSLNQVKLGEYKNNLPQTLSVGMKQRVNFVRAIVCNPDILLLDEPFSALDEITKNEIINDFKKIIAQNKLTTILVTHDIEEAKNLANRIITLESGNINIIESFKNSGKKRLDKFDYLLEVGE